MMAAQSLGKRPGRGDRYPRHQYDLGKPPGQVRGALRQYPAAE
ncbi:hypothetical protein ACFQU2_04000 [Siccirubricoccus deserti]